MVNSFYDPQLDEGCAFEELISFHGGMGGPQTEAFILYPATLSAPVGPIVGAAAVHDLLSGWRQELLGEAGESRPAELESPPARGVTATLSRVDTARSGKPPGAASSRGGRDEPLPGAARSVSVQRAVRFLFYLLVSWLLNAAVLAVVAWIFTDVQSGTTAQLLTAAAVFGS